MPEEFLGSEVIKVVKSVALDSNFKLKVEEIIQIL